MRIPMKLLWIERRKAGWKEEEGGVVMLKLA
jgi:hypothetical protein